MGTEVTVEAGGRTWTKQITLGHGYESVNEHLLTFGLGDVALIDRMQVRWTSGESMILDDLPADSEITVTQGGQPWTIDLVPH